MIPDFDKKANEYIRTTPNPQVCTNQDFGMGRFAKFLAAFGRRMWNARGKADKKSVHAAVCLHARGGEESCYVIDALDAPEPVTKAEK